MFDRIRSALAAVEVGFSRRIVWPLMGKVAPPDRPHRGYAPEADGGPGPELTGTARATEATRDTLREVANLSPRSGPADGR